VCGVVDLGVVRERVPTAVRRPHVVVVGGGISGLAAAWRLCRERHDVDITVLESSSWIGGKLRVSDLDGIAIDEGAESVLATRPEAVALIREAGLGDDLVHPTSAAPQLLVDGDLRPMPTGLVMGVPTDLTGLSRSGILSSQALARLPLDHVLPGTPMGEDISIGEYLGRRLGPQVVDRLVSPLLMGVYADRAVNVSMRAAAPALFEAARHDRSVLKAALEVRAANHPADGVRRPVFAGVRGGVGRLAVTLAERLRAVGVRIETGITARELRRTGRGWQVVLGATTDTTVIDADAVIVAVPAPSAAKLLKGHCLQAETELSDMRTTSVAVVTLLYRAQDLPGGDLPEGSGYLVPPSENRPVKAATFASHKWAWVADSCEPRGLVAVRTSLGHADDVESLQRDDEDLVRLAAQDFAFVARLGRAAPVATRVSRWGGGLPQYAVGHVDRVARITEAVDEVPGLAVCGAAFDGVGIAACIARAGLAATRVSQRLGSDGEWRHG
jgi:oxygen-dependent protoporphyrinogen oxidase